MLQVIDRLKSQSNRDSTRRSYHGIWTRFNKFLLRLDKKPSTWEDRLAIFVAHLIELGRQSATVKSYISAIKCVLVQDGYTWSDDRARLTALTKACKLQNDEVKIRLPIKLGLLEMILFEVDRHFHDQMYLRFMYKAFFSMCYYGLFRVGKLAFGEHQIKAKDVHLAYFKDKILVYLYSSKTHGTYNRPQKVKLTGVSEEFKGNSNFCPFHLIRIYLALRGGFCTNSEPFFLLRDESPLTPDMVRLTLRLMLTNLNLDATLYDCHSFRIGRASDLFYKFHYSLEEVKVAGRWRSNVYKYLRV